MTLDEFIRLNRPLYVRAMRRGVYRYRRGFNTVTGMMVQTCVRRHFRRRLEQEHQLAAQARA